MKKRVWPEEAEQEKKSPLAQLDINNQKDTGWGTRLLIRDDLVKIRKTLVGLLKRGYQDRVSRSMASVQGQCYLYRPPDCNCQEGRDLPSFPQYPRAYKRANTQNILGGLPWWRSGWESACQCRGHGFKARSGKIPHAMKQLGPWATTTEPARLEPVLRNKRGCDSERPAHRDEEWPPLAATRESPRAETKTQHSQK